MVTPQEGASPADQVLLMPASKWISTCVAGLLWLVAGGSALTLRAEDSQWVDSTSTGIFQIRSEYSLSDGDSQNIVEQIEQLQTDVQQMLNLEPTRQPVEISLFRSKSSYQSHLSRRVPEGVNRPALFVQGTDMGRVYVYKRWGFDADLRHESTHAVLHNALPYVPMWLDEGLAEYFEVVASKRSSGNPHLTSLRRSIFFGWRPNLAKLEAAEDLSDMGASEYREAWAWAHFMLHGPPEVRQVLADYLYDIQSGESAGLLKTRLDEALPHADVRMLEHIRTWK